MSFAVYWHWFDVVADVVVSGNKSGKAAVTIADNGGSVTFLLGEGCLDSATALFKEVVAELEAIGRERSE